MGIQGLQRLEVWCRSKAFAVKIYREVLPLLPAEEKWGLSQQLRRASTSISANLAEGYGRYYYQENVHFCYNARGSLEETLSHIAFAHEIGYLTDQLYQALEQEGEELTRMINGYIAYLKKSKQGVGEPGANYSIHDIQVPDQADTPESPYND